MNKKSIKFALLIALALTLALSTVALAEQALNIPLHNDKAEVGTDCPADGGAYWHFVISPNNNKSAFIKFYLNLGDVSTYDTTVFVQNGAQWDNVFVAVPAGKTLDSLSKTGSSADIIWQEDGPQPDKFMLSHVCPGKQDYEELAVSKTAYTSYTREHFWKIAKKVETEFGYTHDGFPKVWLYIDGHGNEAATWTVDVTYEGFEDSAHNVAGNITIENTGTLDAVITSVDDVLAGASIMVDCGVSFPYTLAKGYTLTCSYDEDGYVEGKNEVTVTTERDSYYAEAAIVWGDPSVEINKTVTVSDLSDLFGAVELGTVTAPDGATFTYSKPFAWAGYGAGGCGDFTYNNTATIVETGQSASATLKVNVQCYVYETAYAKGTTPTCFIPTFSNWGWTNYLPARGTIQTWNLYAGAAQCDTSKGTLVGTVTAFYNASGFVTVTYNVGAPYLLKETHVYAGYDKFPKVAKKFTIAPGAYTNVGPFSGPIYVIAHAVVGLPDPNFGPK